jgi:hypothetical protein
MVAILPLARDKLPTIAGILASEGAISRLNLLPRDSVNNKNGAPIESAVLA